MAAMEIALEIGTSYTTIFLSGQGIVLREPTIVAFQGDARSRRVRAVGNAALEMLGKTPDKTTVVTPVIDGIIADPDSCIVMLKEFVRKLLPESFLFFPRIKAILGVPTGLTFEERRAYEDVCAAARINDITVIDNIILSGVGIDLPVASPNGGLIVNIGGGVTEIAALSLGGVITGCGVTIGGNMMDKALIDYLAGKFNLKVGLNAVRKMKHDIGSLSEADNAKYDVEGVDIRTKTPASVTVFATDIRDALLPYYGKISDAIESIINTCKPEIAADIYKTGIYIVGGGSMIFGLEEFMEERLGLHVCVPPDPQYAAIVGGGKLLTDTALLSDILQQLL